MAVVQSKKNRPGFLRRAVRSLLIIIVLMAAGFVFLIATTPGGRLIALTLNRLGSGPSQSVEIDRIDGLVSGTTRIGHVLVKDADGEPWLLFKGIRIDWSPLALLSAGLAIDDLTIERVELARLPPDSKDSDGAGQFTLPLAVDIKRFEAPDILVGAPVAGRVARFEARGIAKVDAVLSTALADLVVKRIDGVGGELTIDADYRQAEDRFNVSAKLTEPAGGVMAHLLKLPRDDAITLSATSQGSLSDWQLSASGLINDEIVASAAVQLTAGETGEAVSVQADGLFGRLLPPALAQFVTGRSTLMLEGLIEPGRSGAVIDVFAFASDKVTAEGRGRLAREGAVDLTASVSPRDAGSQLDFGEGASRVSLAVPEIELRLRGDAAEADASIVLSTDRFRSGSFSADGVQAVVEFSELALATRSGAGTVDIQIASAGSANTTLARAIAGGLSLSGDVALSEGGDVSSGKTTLKSGVAAIDLTSVVYRANGGLEADVAGNVRSAILSNQAPNLLGKELKFEGRVVRDETGSASVSDLRLVSEFAEASGEAALDASGQISAAFEATLSNLSGVNPSVSGGLTATLKASGRASAPEFDIRLSGETLNVQGRDLSGLVFEASGVADAAAPKADVRLTGTLDGEPIDGAARLAQQGEEMRIDPLRLQVAGNLISGTLTLDSAFRPAGVIDLDLKEIGSLSALALQSVSGNGAGVLKFEVRDAVSVADLALGFPALSGEGFAIRDARLTAEVADLLGSPKPTGEVQIASLRAGTTDVSDLHAGFSQQQDWTVFDGKAQAAGFPAAVEGRIRAGEAGTELELQTARTAWNGVNVNLAEPARVVVRDGTAQIERLVISPGGGRVSVSGSAGERLDLAIAISGMPLATVNAAAPGAGLSGTLSGRAQVSGTATAPLMSYDLNATGVRAAAASAIADAALSVSASGGLRDGRLSFDARASGGGLSFAANGGLNTGGARELSARINGSLPFSLISGPLARQGLALTGAAQANIDVSGVASSPRISGTLTTSNARLVDGRSGIAIDGLAATVDVDPGQATIRELSGELSSGGRISGSGSIGLEPGSGYPADLKLKVVRGRYSDGQMVATRFDADLGLSGSLTAGPALNGTVRLDETTVTVPDSLPASIAQLDVTHKNASAAVQEQAARIEANGVGSSSGGLGLDVTVQASRIFVRGRGMDIELGGSLRLTGTTNAPVAVGGFDLVRGRLSVLGKRLDFDRGRLGFAGSVVPILDLAASTSAGSATATVLITGPANAPDFRFTSSPDLPEDEVLALIVFGRSLDNLSPLQIAQLAEAAGQLTGVVKGGGLVESLRRATGVDDIDVRTDEETGATSVGVGKYLNDRTYLGLESGDTAGSGKARIDLDIGRGIKLRGEAGSSGETKGGIFFERDY